WHKADVSRLDPACPLWEAKRTLLAERVMSAHDPELTSSGSKSRSAAPSAGPRCAILSVGSTGTLSSETAQLHHDAWRSSVCLAALGALAAAVNAGRRPASQHAISVVRVHRGCLSPRAERGGVCRWAQCRRPAALGRRPG